jgi:hypothetical protein
MVPRLSLDEPLGTALRLTAIALLLRPMGPWYCRALILGLAAAVLVWPGALRRPSIWLTLAVAIAIRIGSDWPLADNHIYLLAYWCLAVAIALATRSPQVILASSAKQLLGLAFACALVWKALLSPDFMDGRFFRVTFVTDPRFSDAAGLIGGMSAEDLAASRHALEPLPDGAELLAPPEVAEPSRLGTFAVFSTAAVLMLEAAVALAMLLPARFVKPWMPHLALLTFAATTYAFAPVAGFGWLLLVMGAAQTGEHQPRLRHTYVAAFLVILFYTEVPWAGLLLDVLRR